ncbi:DgyrCDS8402 [Dimorphilus gyrociliatus]|uniref:Insulin receptor substrate 1 n=1 Tax=Dimorphilus gyrociliatus TaxID=2664684 RepID=A0A7I8VU10_9ANNE|nr:DgyrCDS8402 [Dimorphilus gyrociliatus]
MAQAGGKQAAKVGFLKKLRNKKVTLDLLPHNLLSKKYFILRSDTLSLEYHDNSKRAFESAPKKSIKLRDCVGFCMKDEHQKVKNVLEIYWSRDVLKIAFDSLEERQQWHDEIKSLLADEIFLPTEWTPKFAKIYQGHLKPQAEGDHGSPSGRLTCGIYRVIVLPEHCIVKKASDEENIEFEVPYKNCVRRVGHKDNYFMIELGRQAEPGPGKFWLCLEDKNDAKSLHSSFNLHLTSSSKSETPSHKNSSMNSLTGSTEDPIRDRAPSNTSTSSKPIFVPQRRPHNVEDSHVPTKKINVSTSQSNRSNRPPSASPSQTFSPTDSFSYMKRARTNSFESATSHTSDSPMDNNSSTSVDDYLPMTPSESSGITFSPSNSRQDPPQCTGYMEMKPGDDGDHGSNDYIEMTPPPGKKGSLSNTPAPYLDMTPISNALPPVDEKTFFEGYVEMKSSKDPSAMKSRTNVQMDRVVSYLKEDTSLPKRANSVGSRPKNSQSGDEDDKCNSAPHLWNEQGNRQRSGTVSIVNHRQRTSTISEDMRMRTGSFGSFAVERPRSHSHGGGSTVRDLRIQSKELALKTVRAKTLNSQSKTKPPSGGSIGRSQRINTSQNDVHEISRSPDLRRLENEPNSIHNRSNYLSMSPGSNTSKDDGYADMDYTPSKGNTSSSAGTDEYFEMAIEPAAIVQATTVDSHQHEYTEINYCKKQ